MTDRRYQDEVDFRRALDDRLRTAVRAEGAPRLVDLRRQFVFECFLARVFSLQGDHWVLKGGTGLAVRLKGARYSMDLDLLTADDANLGAGVTELAKAGAAGDRDPFVFDVAHRSDLRGKTEGVRLAVTAKLGNRVYERFPIDLTANPRFVGPVETLQRPLPVQIDDVQPPPPMRLYPLADQVADKVSAMYELREGRPSTRYRDLVDLVIVVGQIELDPDLVASALRVQVQVRGTQLPPSMVQPAPAWQSNYASAARRAGLPGELCTLRAALEYVGRTLDPVLRGLQVSGRGG